LLISLIASLIALLTAFDAAQAAWLGLISKIARQDLTAAVRGVLYSDDNCLSIYDIMSQHMGL
jgi:hypothetical protein